MLLSFLSYLSLAFLAPESLVGENYRHSALDDKWNNGYPESSYHGVLDQVLHIYGPVVSDRGGELKILRDWSDGAVNMWAERWGNKYILEIPGGMARYHLINESAFIISICHELGHLLGGPPQNGVISYEGQSDYFANQECAKKILASIVLYKPIEMDSEVKVHCKEKFCGWILQGSKSLTSYYAELEVSAFPQIETPEKTQAHQTLKTHPRAQCRLDTLVASFKMKKRPGCWYKP